MFRVDERAGLKRWHPDADPPDRWELMWANRHWLDLARLVEAWQTAAGDEFCHNTLRLSPDETEVFVDHPAIEYAIYRQVKLLLGNRWWNGGLRERVASHAWSELALAVTRGVPYRHQNEWTLRSWVSTIVRHAAIAALRHERPKTQTITPDVLDTFFSKLPEVGEALDRAERLEAVLAASLNLTARQREIVLGRLAGEATVEIAERVGLSPAATAVEFCRAREKLRELLVTKCWSLV